MKVTIQLQPAQSEIDLEQMDTRCRQLMHTFVSQRFTATLMENPDVQRAFLQWMTGREQTASRRTQRHELRRMKSMAEANPMLSTLESEVEKVLLDGRNIVANKSITVGLSRMIDEDFVKKMQAALGRNNGITERMEQAFLVFSATLMTGLRPSEWATAQLIMPDAPNAPDRDHPTLFVQTAKGRGATELDRNLILDGFKQAQLDVIQAAIDTAQALNAHQLGHLSTALRRLARFATEGDHEQELLEALDLKTARKMYAVECLRADRGEKSVAGALGHTTTVNLRWYSQGDIYQDRAMRYPLARITRAAEDEVKDTLQEFKQKTGRVNIGDALTDTDTESPRS